MKIIKFDPDAETEFLESVKYYEECQNGMGRRFRESIYLSLQKISDFPFTYRVLKSPFRRFLLQKFPYGIIYTIEPDHIRIIAIAHTKRKPGFWIDRI